MYHVGLAQAHLNYLPVTVQHCKISLLFSNLMLALSSQSSVTPSHTACQSEKFKHYTQEAHTM